MQNDLYNVLHCHTTFSDGTLTHREVLDKCKEFGIGTVAFTDHDVLMTEETFDDLKSLKHEVKFISGIEFSCTGTPEVEGGIPSFHIIGLFVDHKNQALNEYCKVAMEKRRERINGLVKNLTAQGFSITEQDIMKQSEDGTVGRPHIVRAVLEKPENVEIIKKTLEKMRVESEKDSTLSARYKEIKDNNTFQLMFDLFLSDEAFIKGIYVPYLKQIPLDYAVKLIREAGGIAILAHPSYYKEKLGINLIEKFAREERFDGIETIYAMSPDGETGEDFLTDMDAFRVIVKSNNLVAGGGGDFHTPEDFKRLLAPANVLRMDESKSFLDKIFAKWPKYRENIY